MPDNGNAYNVLQTEEGLYDVLCCLCEWFELDVETLETAGHLGDLHYGDEHFDE